MKAPEHARWPGEMGGNVEPQRIAERDVEPGKEWQTSIRPTRGELQSLALPETGAGAPVWWSAGLPSPVVSWEGKGGAEAIRAGAEESAAAVHSKTCRAADQYVPNGSRDLDAAWTQEPGRARRPTEPSQGAAHERRLRRLTRDGSPYLRRALVLLLVLSAWWTLGLRSAAAASSSPWRFQNPNAISIPNSGPAVPYPSSIVVEDVAGTVTKVTVTVSNLTHGFPSDIDLLLVGPDGQGVVLMADAGDALGVDGVIVTFDDAASGWLPEASSIVSGAYKPTDYGGAHGFPASAPAGPYSATLSAFVGSNPNGTWSLWVADAVPGDGGSIGGGWEMAITTDAPWSPPIIATQPQSQATNAGDRVTFNVVAEGTPPLSYQWFFGEDPRVQATNASLTLTNLQAAQAGSYTVAVSNQFGAVTSAVATLTVLLPPVFTLQPQSQTAAAGAEVTFRVAVSGTPPFGYCWRDNRGVLVSFGEGTDTLTVTNVQPSQAGRYDVIVTNCANRSGVFSSGAMLTVIFPVVPADAALLLESCIPENGAIDPGETVTVNFGLLNTNAPGTSNLVATLLEGGGVVLPSGPQQYDGLVLGGPAVARPFSFEANGPCGGMVKARLRLADGTHDLGSVTFALPLGPTSGRCCVEAGTVDLAVSLVVWPEPAMADNDLHYAVTVTNQGPLAATGVTLLHLLPADVTFVSASVSQGSLTNVGSAVVGNLGNLAGKATAMLTTLVRPVQPGTAISSAQVWANEPDFNRANNAVTATTRVDQAIWRFGNTNRIAIADDGVAIPYPSTLSVAGISGSVSKVTVTLYNFSHTYPSDVAVLLVGPAGQTVFLMSGAGGGFTLSDVQLTLDDAAASALPMNSPLASGSYRPVNYEEWMEVPAPAPTGPYGETLAVFANTDPNGTWSLYAGDAYPGDSGSIAAGWSLTLYLKSSLPPASDAFAGRHSFADSNAVVTLSNTNASKEPGEPDHAGNAGGRSLWWSWCAPASGTVMLSTSGSDLDTLLAVYLGDSLTTLSLVASNDNEGSLFTSTVRFNATSNSTYAIAVDGAHGSAGRIILSLSLKPGQFIYSEEPRDDFWVPNWGGIDCVLETNGVIYIGGEFDYLSPNAGKGQVIDAISGLSDPGFPQTEGAIYDVAADGVGGWYLGGEFTSVGGIARTNLAHVLRDNTVDPAWAPWVDPNGYVYKLTLAENRLYVGGSFTNVSGQARKNLAALEAPTGFLTDWHPDLQYWREFYGDRSMVFAVTPHRNVVYVGGRFSEAEGRVRYGFAAFDAATGHVTPWDPQAYAVDPDFGPDYNRAIGYDIAIKDDLVYVAGDFVGMAGQPRLNLAAVDRESGMLSSWFPELDAPVGTMAFTCDTVYVGGGFNWAGRQARNRLAELDLRTGLATAWNPNVTGKNVAKLLLSHGTIYAAGEFTQVGGQPRAAVAAIDTTTGLPTPWNPAAGSTSRALAIAGTRVLVGSAFSKGGRAQQYLAAFDAATGQILPWDPRPNGQVVALAVSGNILYAAGTFTTIGGQSRHELAALDRTTGAATSWNPSPDNDVLALAVTDQAVYAAGFFSRIGGANRSYIAALNKTTGASTAWNPAANEQVRSLTVSGNTMYAAGFFTWIGGAAREGFAALDLTTGLATSWHADVYAGGATTFGERVLVDGNIVYVGGLFDYINGQPRFNLAAVDAVTSAVKPWNPSVRFGVSGDVQALALSGDLLYVGGWFSSVGGVPRHSMAAVELASAQPTEWGPTLKSDYDGKLVWGMSASERSLCVAGCWSYIGGRYHPNFAVFAPVGAPRILRPPVGQNVPVGTTVAFSVEATGQQPLAYQWQLNATNLIHATNASLILSNVQVADSGAYRVVVTNGLGQSTSLPAQIVVYEPVAMVTQPVSQSVDPGTTVTLSVVATGHPPPHYQWRLNGVNIPGANTSTLTLTNAQPTDGGSYDVVLVNVGSAVSSGVAVLRVASPALAFADHLADHGTLPAASGLGSGSNLAATREAGEPHHAGKLGGKSLWIRWTAPSNGIATFSTRGSSFDTLLGIYTNDFALSPQPTMASLGIVASDEDRGGYLTSQASFNAVASVEYLIAVDGFAGAAGNVVLSWSLDISTVPFPRIITQPLSQSVFAGQDATFSVVVNSATPVRYQWYFGCMPIAGATNSSVTIVNVQPAEVGDYYVVVMNASARFAESTEAYLEIGPEPKVVSQDKMEDLFPEWLIGGLGPTPKGFMGLAWVVQGYISVAPGSIESQILNNTGASTQPGEPLHCGVLGGASKWLRLRPESDGVFLIDTLGSSIDTVLAVYRSTNLLRLSTAVVACDNNSAPDGIRSRVWFDAVRGTDYLAVVDGVNGAQGMIELNWQFGQAPTVASLWPQTPAFAGGGWTLRVVLTNVLPPPSCQWFCNGMPILGATNLAWVAPPVAGRYSVVASNFAGSVEQTVAVLVVLECAARIEQGQLRLRLPEGLTAPVTLEGSGTLGDWVRLQVVDPQQTREMMVPATNGPTRYFRVRPGP